MGPLLGGLLVSADLGDSFESWRLIFYVLGGIGVVLTLMTLCLMKETLILNPDLPRPCPNPLAPLYFLRHLRIFFLIIVLSIGFAGFFAVNISFPTILATKYGYSPLVIGFCYLPFGAGLMLGTGIGGRSADRIRRKGGTPEHRLLPSLLFIPLNAAGIVAQAWVFEKTPHVSILLLISFFLGFTFILPRPGTNTYAIEKLKMITNKDVASSATGLIYGVMLPVAAVIAQLSVIGNEVLGYGIYLSIIAAILFLFTFPIAVFVIMDIRTYKKQLASHSEDSTNRYPPKYDSVN